MSAWCMAHPWMTFFICLALADSARIVVVSVKQKVKS